MVIELVERPITPPPVPWLIVFVPRMFTRDVICLRKLLFAVSALLCRRSTYPGYDFTAILLTFNSHPAAMRPRYDYQ